MLTDSPLSIAGQPHRVLLTIPGAAEPHRVLLSTPTRSTLLPDPTQESTTAAAVTADSGGMWKGSDVSINSPMDSPMVRRAAVNLLLGVPSPVNDSISSATSVSSWSLDEQTTTDDSTQATPLRTHSPLSPAPSRHHHHHRDRTGGDGSRQYRNELWSAIKSDYLYLMDEEIIDACKSTESEISSDEMSSETKVSYNEFLQQYKELTEWLGHIHLIVRQQAASRSENYLTHMYHEEMLKQSPRQQLFNDYARQLLRRYPQLKNEITLRLIHVNEHWSQVMQGLVLPPGVNSCHDTATMLADIREDVRMLRDWVSDTERSLASLHIFKNWSTDKLHEKLVEHQAVQRDIESRSKIVSAVLKLCAWLKTAAQSSAADGGEGIQTVVDPHGGTVEDERASVESEAGVVQQRWHSVWIQSVEWQLKLEDAITGRTHQLRSLSYSDDEQTEWTRMSRSLVEDAELPEYRGNISAATVSAESPESFDNVVPFHDIECKGIGENDLIFSYAVDSDEVDENSSKSAVQKNQGPVLSESADEAGLSAEEAGLDSALGRSVSNPSLHLDNRCLMPALTITEPSAHLNHASGPSGVADFGYSSEGHSNEEHEHAKKPGAGRKLRAVDNRLDQVSVQCDPCPDTVGTSGIGTNLAQRNGSSHMTDASFGASAVNSLIESGPQSSFHREPVGEETDDDFTGLNELPLDDGPSTSELDLLAKLATVSETNCQGLTRAHGRSLDSLAPLQSDKLFLVEKRVSSVEIIIDSVTNSSRPSVSSQMSRESAAEENMLDDIANGRCLLTASNDGHKFSAPSSCDASSEGTLSDSEFSDLGSADLTCSLKKSRSLAKRTRRPVRGVGSSNLYAAASMKSPTKRHLEISAAPSHITRSTSHSAIDVVSQQDCPGVKRSRICKSLSNLFFGQSPKKFSCSRGCRSNLVSSRKVSQHRLVAKLNFAKDISDHEASCLAGDAFKSGTNQQCCVSHQSTDLEDRAVPEMRDSLTSVSWDEDLIVDIAESNSYHRDDGHDVECIATDDWLTEDFSPSRDSTRLVQQGVASTSAQRRTPRSAFCALRQSWPDSDSDTEDFIHVIQESRKAYVFTECTLEQFRLDHVEGSVIHEPAKYLEAIATCQTNIACLLELVEAMQSGTNIDVANSRIQQISDIVRHWRALESRAVSEQADCQQLYSLHVDRVHIARELEAFERSINISDDKFDDIQMLEMTLRAMQAGYDELSTTISDRLTALKQRVIQYQLDSQNMNITGLSAAVDALEQTAQKLAQRYPLAESRLKEAVVTWYQLNDQQRSMEQVIAQQQHQLECLDVATDVVSLSASDLDATIADLQVMGDGWAAYKDKLHLMDYQCCKLEHICGSETLSGLRSAVCAAASDVHCLQRKCRQIIERLDAHRQTQYCSDAADNNRMDEIHALEPALLELEKQQRPDTSECEDVTDPGVVVPAELKIAALLAIKPIENHAASDHRNIELVPVTRPMTAVKISPGGVRSPSPLCRLLHYALPLPLLLIILFGGLYLLCDLWNEVLGDLGLLISPQLKHVRGAPPV